MRRSRIAYRLVFLFLIVYIKLHSAAVFFSFDLKFVIVLTNSEIMRKPTEYGFMCARAEKELIEETKIEVDYKANEYVQNLFCLKIGLEPRAEGRKIISDSFLKNRVSIFQLLIYILKKP